MDDEAKEGPALGRALGRLSEAGVSAKVLEQIGGLGREEARIVARGLEPLVARAAVILDQPFDPLFGGMRVMPPENRKIALGASDALARAGILTYRDLLARFDWSEVTTPGICAQVSAIEGVEGRAGHWIRQHLEELFLIDPRKKRSED